MQVADRHLLGSCNFSQSKQFKVVFFLLFYGISDQKRVICTPASLPARTAAKIQRNKDVANLDEDVNVVSLFGGTSQIVYFMLLLGPGATSKPRMEHVQMFLSPLINLITAHSFTGPV